MKYKKYKKESEYSYALGSFAVLNLIREMPYLAEGVYCHSELEAASLTLLKGACKEAGIPFFEGADREVERVRNKDRELVFAAFQKFRSKLDRARPHIVLDRPSDMGNLGSIFRTALGFGFRDIAIIGNAADHLHPKTVRASMGALFSLRIQHFASFEDYLLACGNEERELYCFMLGSSTELRELVREPERSFSLVFGNESSGLDESYKGRGSAVYIRHSDEIDSLNLGIAASIAMYHFTS
ncbi:MAG: TrmH family RNA methyltransferase [Bacillota bacterium]|nr:TrmH family RNA methyltransferase [Bacillota bacterium]